MAEPSGKLVERILHDGDIVPFTARTQKYGTAEFCFCLVYRRGKLIEIVITPMQQPDATEFFRLAAHGAQSFSANSWTHRGVSNPWAWHHFWCTEHRCPAFALYAPTEATQFEVRHGSDIYFGRGDV
jgi:hypothetical protein